MTFLALSIPLLVTLYLTVNKQKSRKISNVKVYSINVLDREGKVIHKYTYTK